MSGSPKSPYKDVGLFGSMVTIQKKNKQKQPHGFSVPRKTIKKTAVRHVWTFRFGRWGLGQCKRCGEFDYTAPKKCKGDKK